MKPKTLKKIIKVYEQYLFKTPTTPKEQLQHCHDFDNALNKIAPDFDVEKLKTIPFPRLVKKIKEYHQYWIDLLEEFEESAPFHIIHDIKDDDE